MNILQRSIRRICNNYQPISTLLESRGINTYYRPICDINSYLSTKLSCMNIQGKTPYLLTCAPIYLIIIDNYM